ncbi:FtsX-like permease family protein [Exiguobacterium acetylicum]|uniref:FtsX-like permease family protein n=1 Tax=Exiguobacterium acetylicum TaxID=41170 RepID=UPI0034D3ED12
MSINYLQYALRNIRRYQRLYYGYALTIIIAMTIVTSYWNLLTNRSFQNVAKVLSQLNQVIELTIFFVFTAELIILLFSILFIYSTTYTMLEHRKNDLRTMRTLGSGLSHFLKYFLIEVLIVGGFAITAGLVLGNVLTKMLLLSVVKVMFLPPIEFELSFYAILALIGGALIVLLTATVLAIYRFRPDRPVRLRSPFRRRIWILIQVIALLTLIYGYTLAFIRMYEFYIVFPLVIFIGSFFICRYVLPWLTQLYRPRRLSLRKLIVSEIANQLRTNSTLIALGTILTSCALTAVGLVFLFQLVGLDLSSQNQFGLVYYEESAQPTKRLKDIKQTMTKAFPDRYQQDIQVKADGTRVLLPISAYNKMMRQLHFQERTATGRQSFFVPARPVQLEENTPTMKKAKQSMEKADFELLPAASHDLVFGYNYRIETMFVVSDAVFQTLKQPVRQIVVFDTPAYHDYGTKDWEQWMKIVRNIQSAAKLDEKQSVPYQLINETEDEIDGIRIVRLVTFVVILLTIWLFVINASFLHVWMQMTAEQEQKRMKTLFALGFGSGNIRRYLLMKYGAVLLIPYLISVFHAFLLFQVVVTRAGLQVGSFLDLAAFWISIVTIGYFLSVLPIWLRYPRHLFRNSSKSSMYPTPDSRV